MALTDTAIRNLKPQRKPCKKSDSEGLQLHVMPEGSKLRRLVYRFAGRRFERRYYQYRYLDTSAFAGATVQPNTAELPSADRQTGARHFEVLFVNGDLPDLILASARRGPS
jgi:hypothetical protein